MMTFRDHFRDSHTLMRAGMVSLALALLASRFVHPSAYLSEDAADAVKGFLMGISIALLMVGVRRRTDKHA